MTGIRLIIDQLLRDNNFLYRYQSGFRRHHLTKTALINIYDRLMNINKMPTFQVATTAVLRNSLPTEFRSAQYLTIIIDLSLGVFLWKYPSFQV